MNCPKCNRKISGDRKTCLYCGESICQQPIFKKTFSTSNGNIFYVQSEKTQVMDFADIPEKIRTVVENAIHEGEKQITIQDESRVFEYTSNGKSDNQMPLSMGNTLSLLSGIKASYEQGQIMIDEYEKMVLEFIKDFLASIDDSDKIRFVVNGIKNSELMVYLNDDMLLKLRRYIIDSVSNK